MATHKSAEKRARQNIKRQARNSGVVSLVRNLERKVRATITAKDIDKAKTLLRDFMSEADSAVSKGALHYKTAARKVGNLSAKIASLIKN